MGPPQPPPMGPPQPPGPSVADTFMGASTDGAAAEVMNFDRVGKKGTPWHLLGR